MCSCDDLQLTAVRVGFGYSPLRRAPIEAPTVIGKTDEKSPLNNYYSKNVC